ncbi:hypothetical protein ABBQ32_003215 [Trebouxia sp. C0010 RCD-2024]
MGVAGLICRHEFVLVIANLFTEENFAYYDLMLEQLVHEYAAEGRELVCFFLDIACQFKKYWDRLHPDHRDVTMAIGPWLARVHKALCQQEFGARCTKNTG